MYFPVELCRLFSWFLPEVSLACYSMVCKLFVQFKEEYLASIKPNDSDISIYAQQNKILSLLALNKPTWEHALEPAGQAGNLRMIQFLVTKCGYFAYHWGLYGACRSDSVETVKFMLDLEPSWWRWGCVNYSYNLALRISCGWRRLEIVKLLIERGAGELDDALFTACRVSSNMQVISYLLRKGAKPCNVTVICSCESGNLGLVKMMMKLTMVKGLSINDVNDCLVRVCRSGNIKIVKLIIRLGATHFEDGACEACTRGHGTIVKLMIDCGARNWIGMIYAAQLHYFDNIVRLIRYYKSQMG